MAKILNTSGASNIWLGSKSNSRQSILYVPAQLAANKPGLIFLESIDDAGAVANLGGVYLWADDSNALRYSATYPTDQDGSGTAVGVAGAATTLNNVGSTAIPEALISDAVNTDDLGSDALPWKSLYLGTNVVFDRGASNNLLLAGSDCASAARTVTFGDPGGAESVAYLATSQSLTNKSYNGMSVTCATNAIALVNNTGNITVAAAGSIDVGAAGTLDVGTGSFAVGTGAVAFTGDAAFNQANDTDIDINGDITIGTGGLTTSTTAVTLDQDLQVSASPTFVAIACQGITNTTTAIDTTAQLQVGADNVNLTFGVDDATDSRIYFDGTHLKFYDSNLGVATSLTSLASGSLTSPTVTGDMTLSDGKITWNDGTNEVAGAWTFDSNTTASAITISVDAQTSGSAIAVANTGGTFTGDMFSGTSASGTSGTIYYANQDESTLSGYYFEAYDSNGSSTVFGVKKYGEIEITGNAGSMITIDVGNIALTDGDLAIAEGKITVDTVTAEQSYFKRNNAAPANAVLLVHEDHDSADEEAIEIVHDPTGAIDAMKIGTAGTGYGLLVDMGAAGGKGINVTQSGAASGTASYLNLDGASGTAAWIGGAGVGMLQINSDGTFTNADSHLVQIDNSGQTAASTTGASLHITDASTGGTTAGSAVYISSAALDAVNIITTAVGAKQILCTGVTGQTADMVYLDATPTSGWIGAAGGGVLKIVGDGEIADADSSMLQINYSGQGDDSATGTCIRSLDSGTATGTQPSYANYFSSTNNDAVAIVTGSAGVANLTLTGITGQTESMLIIDASTGAAGWIGGDEAGALKISGDNTLNHVDASMLNITHTGIPKANHMGSCLRIVESGNAASGTGYAMYLQATDADMEALYIPDGKVAFKENLNITIDASENCDALTIDQNDSNNNKDGVVVNTTGTGYALKVTSDSATNKGSHFIACQEQTTSVITIDGTAGTSWDGANDIGMLHLKHDLALDAAGASLLYVTSSAIKSDAEGALARFEYTGAAQTGACAVEIEVPTSTPALASNGIVKITGQDSPGAYLVQITANDDTGNKGAVDIHASGTDPALRVTGDEDDTPTASFIVAANTDVSGVLIDGDTAGWLGADAVGMLHLQNDIAGGHANATMLLIDKNASSIAEVASAEGSCLRIVENMDVSGTPPAYAMYISCVDNEALHVDSGVVVIDEYVTAGVASSTAGGLVTAYYTANLTDTPTDAEFDTAFGATALAQAGFIGVAYDSSLQQTYIVCSDGTNWYYTAAMTKAT